MAFARSVQTHKSLVYLNLTLNKSIYSNYPKYLDTSTHYHTCLKIWTSTTYYSVLCLKIAGQVANCVDPDDTPWSATSHLGLHCLLRPVCPNSYGKYSSYIIMSKFKIVTEWAGLGGSVGCAVRLETRRLWVQPPPRSIDWLIVLGFNDTSTLEGHFVSSPRERKKRDRRESRGDEREGQGRKRNRKESEETEEIKTFPLYPYPLQG